MKEKLNVSWQAFKAAFPFVVIAWAMVLVTFILWRLADPGLLQQANPILLGLIGSIITALFVAIHHLFKQRQNNKCNHD